MQRQDSMPCIGFLLVIATLLSLGYSNLVVADDNRTKTGWPTPPTSDECWQLMPASSNASRPPLPSWIRMIAKEMPKTAAAFLELDLAQRTLGPVDLRLRAATNATQYWETRPVDPRKAGA